MRAHARDLGVHAKSYQKASGKSLVGMERPHLTPE
uniref:Uncharacterized protein n=1 Tax=Lepeophtheirus salmonis TaxID=72036 RepID=A0A0K2T399_LEPSM